MNKKGFLNWLIAFLVLCIVFGVKVYYEINGIEVTGLVLVIPLVSCYYLAKDYVKFPRTFKQFPIDKFMVIFIAFIVLVLLASVVLFYLEISIDSMAEPKGISSVEGLIFTVGLFWVVVSLQVYYIWNNKWFNDEVS